MVECISYMKVYMRENVIGIFIIFQYILLHVFFFRRRGEGVVFGLLKTAVTVIEATHSFTIRRI